MTTKRLSGVYANGFRLSPRFDRSVIETTAHVRGVGIQAFGFATVMNQGSVYGSTQGVYLAAGGLVQNGSASDTTASITGYQYGVRAHGAVANFGTIHASGDRSDGVALISGGSLTTGSVRPAAALISGYNGVFVDAIAAVANLGTVEATGQRGDGAYILEGGIANRLA
jgi:hypothetical protein